MNFVLASIFGLIALACVFVLFNWWPVLANGETRRYKMVAMGMLAATFGMTLLAVNRTSVALFDTKIFSWLLLLAGVTILTGEVVWLWGSTSRNKRLPLYAFMVLSAAWVGVCLWWFRGQ